MDIVESRRNGPQPSMRHDDDDDGGDGGGGGGGTVGSRTLDQNGHGFDSRPVKFFTPMCSASVARQYKLVPAKAGK